MNALKKAALFCAFLLVSIAALGQTAVSGTRVVDNTGALLVSGEWCFGATCLTVTNGAFSGTVFAGTQTVTVTDGGSNTYLTIPGVIIGSSLVNWDLYVVPMTASISGMGMPRIACASGAAYTQTDAPSAIQNWQCSAITGHGQAVWINTSGFIPLASGNYTGLGTPTFTCTVPCTFTRSDNSTFYTLNGTMGAPSNAWVLVSGGGGGNPPNINFAGTSSGGAIQTAPYTPVNKTGDTMSGALVSPALNNLANAGSYIASASGNVTNGLNAYIAAQIASGQRGTLWIDPTQATGSPTSSYTSAMRIWDLRGNTLPTYYGVPASAYYNATLFEGFEDQQSSAASYNAFGNFWSYYHALRGGTYNFNTNTSTGAKTDYFNQAIFSTFDTIGQKWGVQNEAWSTGNGETINFSCYQSEFAGYQSSGEEPPQCYRVEMLQGSASFTPTTGGVFGGATGNAATISSITGPVSGVYTVNYTGTSLTNGLYADEVTTGEHCCFRDLGTGAITGSYTSVSVAANTPVSGVTTVTVNGSGFTSGGATVGYHSGYQGGLTSPSQPNAGAFFVTWTDLCLTISGAQHDGYDVIIPVDQVISGTQITVIPQAVGSQAGTSWFSNWPTSGTYKLNNCALPSSVNKTAHSIAITSPNAPTLTAGDRIDQTLAYNYEQQVGNIVTIVHIGVPNAGGGFNFNNDDSAGGPGRGPVLSISGQYLSAIHTRAIASGNVSNLIQVDSHIPGALIWDNDATAVTASIVYRFNDTAHVLHTPILLDNVPTDPNFGMQLFPSIVQATGPIQTTSSVFGATSVASSAGGIGTVANMLKDSAFQTVSGTTIWSQVNNSSCSGGSSITPTANAATDPWGGNTAETVVIPNPFGGTGCAYMGQKQSLTLVNGQQYTLSGWFSVPSGTASIFLAIGDTLSPGCTSGTFTATTTSMQNADGSPAQPFSITCTWTSASSSSINWHTTNAGATINVYGFSLKTGGPGVYVTTTSSPISPTPAAAVKGVVLGATPDRNVATLASGTVTVTDSNACAVGAACVYKFTNCGPSGTAIGVPSLATVVAGTSFIINSISATNTVVTGDTSKICWQIN